MPLSNQTVQQAVIVAQDNIQFGKGSTRLALFDEKGSPINLGDTVSVKQYGAVGDGVSDDYASLQNALDNVNGKILHFPTGVYKISSRIDITKNDTYITADPGAVIDFSSVQATGSAKVALRAQGTLSSSTTLSVNATKGLYSLTVTNASNFVIGDWVRISSNADYLYSTNFKRGEIKRIRAISSNTITFEQALYDNYVTTDATVITKINMISNISISGLTFRGADLADHNDRGISLEFVSNFSVQDNVFTGIDQYCLYVRSCVIGDISHNRFRGVFYDGDVGTIFYAILLSSSTQWVRCHSNYGDRVRHLITISAATNDPGQPRHITCTGNVAQNLMAGFGGRSWAYECHGVGENILFEANVADGCYGGFVTRGPGVSIIGNSVRNWYAYAIHIHPEIVDARDIIIRSNTVQDRTIEGGGFITPAAIRAELSSAQKVSNVIISGNDINYDVVAQPSIKVDGSTVVATSLVVRDNNVTHVGNVVDSISLTVNGGLRHGNVVNGIAEGDDSLSQFRSAFISTMPREVVGSTIGTVSSGQLLGARAKVLRAGIYTKIRFCTGTTAPVATDFRVGVWDSSGVVLAQSNNEGVSVIAASTIYELSLVSPITLYAGQEVFIGFGVIGSTPGTYRGNASFSAINSLPPVISLSRTGWTTGTILNIVTGTSAIPWVELI